MARELGESDVDALLARLSTTQLREWMAFRSLDPFTGERLELMLARLSVLVANRTRGKDERAYTLQDFLPDYGASEAEIREEKAGRLRMKMLGMKLLRNLRGD